jgi:signal transduction histidine kinase
VVSATRSRRERAGDRLAGWKHQLADRRQRAQPAVREADAFIARVGEMVRFGPGGRAWRTRLAAEPSAALFRRIRLRLTVWYTCYLAAALLVLGIALYWGVSRALLSPIDDDLHAQAQRIAEYIQADPALLNYCQAGESDLFGEDPHLAAYRGIPLLAVCYGQNGAYSWITSLAQGYPGLRDPSLAAAAVRSGSASDTINLGPPLGRVRVYAVLVSNGSGPPFTVVETAGQVGAQLDALHTLLTLLLVMGSIALVVAAVGGSFLADKALAPARLAYARQRDFISDASHELRTPLTMLRADAEVLLRSSTRFDPEDAEILHDIVGETAHMSALADNMLNLARLDSGEMPLEQEVVDLTALAAEIGRRMSALAAERGLSVHVDQGEPVLVVADRLLLEQTILILVDNAVKYNQHGGEVAIRVARQGDRAMLTVRDTGIGIAAEHLPHLGERFYRVDKARSREMGGAGLGVSIARSIARRHGGTLELTSTPGEGTTATLSLPAAG